MTGRRMAMRAVKVAASTADRVRPPARGVVVLAYHLVHGATGSEVDLPRALFEEQMSWLAESRRVASLDDALSMLDAEEAPEADPVVVTFDDGTADFCEQAMPVLAEHRVPVTLYVATDYVERGRPFPGGGRAVSWTALRDALGTGLVAVGSHTHTHSLLDRCPVDVVRDELDRSVALIGDRLGVHAVDFAYPKGVAGSPTAEPEVRARFRSAALGGNRANPYGRTDRHRLSRSAVQVADGMRFFLRKVEGGMGMEDDLRRLLNRRRYRDLTA